MEVISDAYFQNSKLTISDENYAVIDMWMMSSSQLLFVNK